MSITKDGIIEALKVGQLDLRAENAHLQAKLDNQEPWLVALGRMLVEYRIARFPDDVLAWRDERDALPTLM